MRPAVLHDHETAPTPQTPCVHCGLPVGRSPVGDPGGPVFCCTGCKMVYETLQTSGLGDTYYRLKDVGSDTGLACPAPTSLDPLLLSELDSPSFTNEHTRGRDDGARTAELFLDGVHCAACVWLVERLPFELDGVIEARLDLPRARLEVAWDPDRVTLSEIARWLGRVGYSPHPKRRTGTSGRTAAERRLLRKAGTSWAIAGNVMLLAVAGYAGLDFSSDPALATFTRYLSLLIALPALIYGGSEFFAKAWASIRISVRNRDPRNLHMDTPISLGILIGFVHSAWATVTGNGEVWFDSITVLIAALLTARWLQLRSRRFAGDATERLLSLIPTMVRRIEADGSVSIVAGTEVRIDDLVEVPPGEVIPVDGSIASGHSAVNNAVLTGESRPQEVEPGSLVTAGATNVSAPLQIRVRATGEDTRIGSLLAWIRDAGSQRAPVVLLANRLSAWFVLTVLGLAAITLVVWYAIDPDVAVPHVVALLVITCPCALGMATPLAMAIAAGQAARAGIFIKTDEATQQLTHPHVVVLDKTGTVTEGSLSLVEVIGDPEAARLGAVLETRSTHPLAFALAQAFPPDSETEMQLEAFESVPGNGVRGKIDGDYVAVGRPEWLRNAGASTDPALEDALERFARSGYTPVSVAVNGRLRAALAFGDRLRDEAPAVIQRFRNMGARVYLLSGDHPAVVQEVARQLGLPDDAALGAVDPEGKRAFIEELTRTPGQTVIMVGDGVNDAAALQAASVGIAVQGGSTASLVAADVFLTRPGLGTLSDLVRGARNTMRVIRRNLGISLVYNILGAGAAIAGLVTPLVAAVAMPVSSLVVVVSSILQRSFHARTRA